MKSLVHCGEIVAHSWGSACAELVLSSAHGGITEEYRRSHENTGQYRKSGIGTGRPDKREKRPETQRRIRPVAGAQGAGRRRRFQGAMTEIA
jgi:hypothetical protein